MNKILSVSQLNNYIKNVFDDELILQNITVEGEIGEIKFSGGNTYITLSEGDCVLFCVKFGAKIEYSIGEKIRVTGSVRFYPRGCRTTFVVTYASSVGKGEQLVKLNELKDKLSKEGIFDNAKSLPPFIKKIALVTSTEGAVRHDFTEVLERNGCSYLDVDIYGVKVQGTDAPQSISKALMLLSDKNYDVAVVARGGGSEQDLGCFNSESVARNVFACPLPIISAIGHEVNYTLCDFAASIRAGTPSIAAELIVRNNEAFLSCFYNCLMRMRSCSENLLGARANLIMTLSSALALGCERKASEIKAKIMDSLKNLYFCNLDSVSDAQHKIVKELDTIRSKTEKIFDDKERELKYATAILDKSSPLKILSDGYAKVMKSGFPVKGIGDIDVGDKLKIVMSGGVLGVTVNEKE